MEWLVNIVKNRVERSINDIDGAAGKVNLKKKEVLPMNNNVFLPADILLPKNADMTKKQKRLTQKSAHRALSAE